MRRLIVLVGLVAALGPTASGQTGVVLPPWPPLVSGLPSIAGTYVLNANGEKGSIICAATAAKNAHIIYVRTGTVTTGDTVDVRVETVDTAANGDPTGTLWNSATTNDSNGSL